MGTALLRVMRGIVAPALGTGPTAPRPPLRACPRHPPLGLGYAGLVGGSCLQPATASAWRSVVLLVGRDPGVPDQQRTGPSAVLPDPRRGQSHKSPAGGPGVRL